MRQETEEVPLKLMGVRDERHWWLPGPETSYHVGINQNSDTHGPSKLFISNLNPSITHLFVVIKHY